MQCIMLAVGLPPERVTALMRGRPAFAACTQVWAGVDEFRRVWTRADGCGWVWAGVDEGRRVWTRADGCGWVWAGVDEGRQMWMGVGKYSETGLRLLVKQLELGVSNSNGDRVGRGRFLLPVTIGAFSKLLGQSSALNPSHRRRSR
eukprot:366433-Chlamydomonas_euryale.AAC.20